MKRLILFVVCSFWAFQIYAKVVENNVIKSKILNRDVSYSIYLPDGYDSDLRSYPIIYLLPGYGNDHTTWIQKGNIGWYADREIREGRIVPVIIAIPDGGVGMYVNSFSGKNSYEDFFVREFIPQVEDAYRVRKGKYNRGITGNSMGGWGSMLYALKYPDMFAAAAPLSAGIHDDYDIINYDNARWETVFGSVFGYKLKGKDRLNEYWYKNSILKIVETTSAEDLQKVKFRISCGDQDYLLKGSLLLHLALADKKVQHQLRIKGGGHTWDFWCDDISEALEFIASNFE
jgi:S-formylglutathione hydrolase FrmB